MYSRLSRFIMLCLIIALSLIPIGCNNAGSQSSPDQAQAQKPAAPQTELTIAAAASLTDALTELKQTFEQDNPTIKLTFTYGSSGKLAQQIIQGAPVDLFLSASQVDLNKVKDKNLLAVDSMKTFARNELVLIAPKDSTLALQSFKELGQAPITHLAVGEPKTVPAGRYTQQVLTQLGLWDHVQKQVVLGADVRQVLTYVESGNTEAGVVYASDAHISDKVKILATAQPEWHDPIIYPGAILSGSAHPKEAAVFLDYLTSDKGQQILKKYGFQ